MMLNLVLPAAGLGSRFQKIGETIPKPLIPVFGFPMIVWVLMNFTLQPSDKVWIICQKDHQIPRLLKKYLMKFSFEIEFLEISELTEGPASSVYLVSQHLSENDGLIVANSDQFVFSDTSNFIREVRSGNHAGQILTMSANSDAWSYVGRNSAGKIVEVVEKKQISDEASVGVYGWSKVRYANESFEDTFSRNIRTNGEFYVAPTYNYLLDEGFSVEGFNIGAHGTAVHGLGTPTDLSAFLSLRRSKEIAQEIEKFYKV